MIKKEIIDTISDLNFWGKDQDTGIIRTNYLKNIEKILTTKNFAVSIIGVRRAGKTYITKQLLENFILKNGIRKEQTLYINFEEPYLRPYLEDISFIDQILETYKYYINEKEKIILVLDEVQNIHNWESWVRIMLEKKENVKIIVTGSSAALLSGELGTKLTGRTLTTRIFPLNFKEFLLFKNVNNLNKKTVKNKDMERYLREFIEFGGFPEVVLTEDREIKQRILKELFDGIVSRDIIERHHIRQPKILKSLAALALQNFASLTSVPKLVNIFENVVKRKISPTSINQYLDYFSESFLMFQVPIYALKVKEQMQYPKKLYCIDTGLINAVSFKFSEDFGRLSENLVFIELLRLQLNRVDLEIYYWKQNGKEVDFVLKEGLSVVDMIQVCWDITDPKTKKREMDNLLSAMDEFDLELGIIVTGFFEGEEKLNSKKIIYIPVWKFLMDIGQFL
jgi:predicted AAA+ superfamily ATPase